MAKEMKIIHLFLTACIIMSAWSALSQQPVIDSLIQLASSQDGKDKTHTLINISREYFINGDTLSLKYSREAIDLSKSFEYELGVGQAMLFHGLGFADIQPDSALKYYIKSSEILSRMEHPWAHFGYKNAADIYMNKGWFPEALELTFKILEINEKSGDTLLMVESVTTLGLLHYNLKNYPEALFWQRKALETLDTLEHNRYRGLIYGRMGIVFDEQEVYDSAFYYNNLALEYFSKAGDQHSISQWKSNLANSHIKLENYDKAEKLLSEALTDELNDDKKAIIKVNLANVYIKTQRYQLAENLLKNAYDHAVRFHQMEFLSQVWFRKHELSEALGNTADALKYYRNYVHLRDSILNVTKTEQLAQMLARYEMEEKEKELLFEKAEKERIEKERVQAQLSAGRIQKWIWGISVFSIIVVLHILFFMLRLKRKAQHEKQMAIIEEQEKGFAAVINAQEEERKRVAKDLHDGIGQQISALSLNFQVLTAKVAGVAPSMTAEVEKIKRLIQNTSQDVREVSHQMMPRALTEFGLIDALEDMIDICFSDTSIECTFNHQNMEERLPQYIEIGLYRVCQELLSNIIKHANAKTVDINLYRTQSWCTLAVSDDGRGIDPRHSKGLGLTSINTRVAAMKGTFRLSSVKGKGTTATIKIKL
jgi:signal transduction histidine kinase